MFSYIVLLCQTYFQSINYTLINTATKKVQNIEFCIIYYSLQMLIWNDFILLLDINPNAVLFIAQFSILIGHKISSDICARFNSSYEFALAR